MSTSSDNDILKKWRLILGSKSDPSGEVELSVEQVGMSNTLDALYDSEKRGGLGASSPNVNRWLGDIRTYFPASVVQIMQRDALTRLGLQRMLLEKELLEAIEPDVHLVGTLLSLSKILPKKSKETARQVVKKVTDQLQKKLRQPLVQAVRGSLNRAHRTRRPKQQDIDWNATIQKNLKHYQPEHKTVIPEQLVGFKRQQQQLRHVFVLIDQSGSMASSVVYAGVFSCILASLRSIKTTVIAFDTNVVDLSEHLSDPVELLFATQLGGGTDIATALQYTTNKITASKDSIVILISDLFEGGNVEEMFRQCQQIKTSGAQMVSLLALSDDGAPAFDRDHAQVLATMGIPSFACTPDKFPELMADAIERKL